MDKNRQKNLMRLLYIPAVLLIFTAGFFSNKVFAAPNREKDDAAPIYRESSPTPMPKVLVSPEDLQNSFRAVAERVLPVVIEINTIEVIKQSASQFSSPFEFFFGPQGNQQPSEQEFRRPGLGSGVIVGREGKNVYAITNNHVAGSAAEMSVRLYDARQFSAKLVGGDARADLALIVFETEDDVPIAELGDSNALYVGDWVLAVGNPYGYESTVTAGIISALGRRAGPDMPVSGLTDYIQTDAAINPGNSGGALVNLKGQIIGINTWIASQTGGNVGLGFAIPINDAKRAVNDFVSKGRITYGWLGISIQDVDPRQLPGIIDDLKLGKAKGALVVNVYKDSPAAKGGILPGDFVTSVDSKPVTNAGDLSRLVGNQPPGTMVEFSIIRLGEKQSLAVKLTERPMETDLQKNNTLWPGLIILGLTEDMRKQLKVPSSVTGVLAASVFQDSPVATAGFKHGDIITKLGSVDIKNAFDFYKALNDPNVKELNFRIFRQGTEISIGITK